MSAAESRPMRASGSRIPPPARPRVHVSRSPPSGAGGGGHKPWGQPRAPSPGGGLRASSAPASAELGVGSPPWASSAPLGSPGRRAAVSQRSGPAPPAGPRPPAPHPHPRLTCLPLAPIAGSPRGASGDRRTAPPG